MSSQRGAIVFKRPDRYLGAMRRGWPLLGEDVIGHKIDPRPFPKMGFRDPCPPRRCRDIGPSIAVATLCELTHVRGGVFGLLAVRSEVCTWAALSVLAGRPAEEGL